MTSIFDFSDYKSFLKDLLLHNKDKRGFQAQLAKAAGCQASYLSQVLTAKSELLPDHALGMAQVIGLTELEMDYFLELVRHSRANSSSMKKYSERKLADMRVAKKSLSERVPAKTLKNAAIEPYYFSSWYWTAVHIATSVLEYQSIEALSERLKLSKGKIRKILETLERDGLVQYKDEKWLYLTGAGHLPNKSFMTEMNHQQWRQRALLNVQEAGDEDVHYTSVVSMTKEDSIRLAEYLRTSIGNSRTISDPSEPEEVYCLTLDFFKV